MKLLIDDTITTPVPVDTFYITFNLIPIKHYIIKQKIQKKDSINSISVIHSNWFQVLFQHI